MHVDLTRDRDVSLPDADVCVVGAGPAGLVVARELAERGREVLVLESGADAPDAFADALNDGDVVGDAYAGLRATRHRQVGGTMQRWNTAVAGAPGAKWVPLDPTDVDGHWPFGYDTLRPYYARAQRLCTLGPPAYDAASWTEPDRAPLPLDGSHLVSRVYQLGPRDALLAPTLQRLREVDNATLLTRATVVRLELDAGGRRVCHAVVATPDGATRQVRARRFVLAAGAVENARLLFLSACGGDQVGRGFMEHPRDRAIWLRPHDARAYRRLAFYDTRVAPNGTTVLGRLALADAALRGGALPNASATLLPHPRASLGRLRLGGPGWTRLAAPRLAFDGVTVLLNVEQRPHLDNRVVLGSRRDALGLPLPELRWRWRAEEHERLVRLRALVARALAAVGVGEVRVRDDAVPDPNAHHHAGTTRMHADPRGGVVDADGRVHGTDNLYAAGASVFPTAGFANPTLTVVALALRLAERLDSLGTR